MKTIFYFTENAADKRIFSAFLLSVILLTQCFLFPAKAFELEKDELYVVDNLSDFFELEKDCSPQKVKLKGISSDEPLHISSDSINTLEFEECNFSSTDIVLPETVSTLKLTRTEFKKYDFIKNSTLQELDLTGERFNDLSFIPDTLYSIGLYQSNIPSLKGIEKCKTLYFVEIYDVNIESIENLRNLKSISTLVLCGTFIDDISPVENLPLNYLDVSSSTRIRSLEPITNIETLETFYAYNCEMALTQKVVDFVQNHGFTECAANAEGLDYQLQVKEIAEKIIKNDMTEDEKIYAVTKYVVEHMEFDDKFYEDDSWALELNRNGLKYALNGIGVCKNYTTLEGALLRLAGIDNYDIISEDHIWNAVRKGNRYYGIDATFIDSFGDIEMENDENYMEPYESFEKTHIGYVKPAGAYNIQTEETSEEPDITEKPTEKSEEKTYEKDNKLIFAVIIAASVLAAGGIVSAFVIRKKKTQGNFEHRG